MRETTRLQRKKQKKHLIEDSPAFFLNLRILASLKTEQNKTKAFTKSVRANELLFSGLEKKYIIKVWGGGEGGGVGVLSLAGS